MLQVWLASITILSALLHVGSDRSIDHSVGPFGFLGSVVTTGPPCEGRGPPWQIIVVQAAARGVKGPTKIGGSGCRQGDPGEGKLRVVDSGDGLNGQRSTDGSSVTDQLGDHGRGFGYRVPFGEGENGDSLDVVTLWQWQHCYCVEEPWGWPNGSSGVRHLGRNSSAVRGRLCI